MSNIGGNSYVGRVKAVPVGKGSGPEKSISGGSGGGISGGSLSAGVGDGLSSCSKFESASWGPSYNFAVDPITGNSAGDIAENPSKRSAKKNGESYVIC